MKKVLFEADYTERFNQVLALVSQGISVYEARKQVGFLDMYYKITLEQKKELRVASILSKSGGSSKPGAGLHLNRDFIEGIEDDSYSEQ